MKELLKVLGLTFDPMSPRRDVELSITIVPKTIQCGNVCLTCSHRGNRPFELFVNDRELNYHRQDTCGWALRSMGRSISLLLQGGRYSVEEVAHVMTKEQCPVWSEMSGHMTCPELIKKFLTDVNSGLYTKKEDKKSA